MKIALLGAGGKMGVRLATNLQGSGYLVDHVEISAIGRERLKSLIGVDCVSREDALADADIVLLAVPDRLIGKVVHEIVHQVRSGTRFIALDAAAPHAGELPERDDVTYFVTHPCHPSIFNDETDPEAKRDFFGGVLAKQHIVCALMQGPESDYELCDHVARQIYKPVITSHRCTVEQLAILEPALSEQVALTMCSAMREAMEEAIRMGVPREAAKQFLLGHINIGLSVAFEIFPEGRFSEGALYTIEKARPHILKEGWLKKIFTPEAVLQSVKDICAST